MERYCQVSVGNELIIEKSTQSIRRVANDERKLTLEKIQQVNDLLEEKGEEGVDLSIWFEFNSCDQLI